MSFKNYLHESALTESYDFLGDGSFSLHWSNWRKSSLFLKGSSAKDTRLAALESELMQLKMHYVWLAKGIEQRQWNLFELYSSLFDPKFSSLFNHGPAGGSDILVSTGNQSGPYLPMRSKRWVDPDVYRKFIYYRILTQVMPLRDFRLSVDYPVFSQINGEHWHDQDIKIKQVSRHGVLLDFGNFFNKSQFHSNLSLELLIDLGSLAHSNKGQSWSEFLGLLSEKGFSSNGDQKLHKMINLSESLEYGLHREQYLFIPYKDLDLEVSKALKSFVERSENHLDYSLIKAAA
jgi:hypothetical protein